MDGKLNERDIHIMQALDQKFDMDADSNTKRLVDCGWADFYGITIGGEPIDTDKLLALGYIEARPHPVWEGQSVYRLISAGREAIEGIPTYWDRQFTSDAEGG